MVLKWEIGSWTDIWRIEQFKSAAVGGDVSFYIYLPPGYESGNKRYPVVYWLHAAFARPYSATPIVQRLDAAIRTGSAMEMIFVSCIDPTGLSMWTNSKDGRLPMETMIIEELIPHVDTVYRTVAHRCGRAMEGFSMGGYGSAYLGIKFKQLFSSVSVLSGALHTPETLREQRRSIFANVYSDDIEYATEHSPWTIIKREADEVRHKVKMRVFVGADDELLEWNTNYHTLLDDLGVAHDWGVVPNSPHDLEILMQNWQGDFFAYYKDLFGSENPGGD
ncbi:MAG: alpha/beta hydrolase-fold protein [Woeseiaceae bacterium]|jgi:endo-1,4-beta-xylanase